MAEPRNSSATVVVVGGGVAGAFVSKSLQSHAQVVLIEPYSLSLSLSTLLSGKCFSYNRFLENAFYAEKYQKIRLNYVPTN